MNLGFRVTREFVKELLGVLDEIIEEVRQKREVVKKRMRKLPRENFNDRCAKESRKTR